MNNLAKDLSESLPLGSFTDRASLHVHDRTTQQLETWPDPLSATCSSGSWKAGAISSNLLAGVSVSWWSDSVMFVNISSCCPGQLSWLGNYGHFTCKGSHAYGTGNLGCFNSKSACSCNTPCA